MLDLEVIKWGCQFAEGFEWLGRSCNLGGNKKGKELYYPIINTPAVGECLLENGHPLSMEVYYPLLLQAIIKGINKKYSDEDSNFNWNIKQDYAGVYVLKFRKTIDSFDFGCEEKAIDCIFTETKDSFCPSCKGVGNFGWNTKDGKQPKGRGYEEIECGVCNGTGRNK